MVTFLDLQNSLNTLFISSQVLYIVVRWMSRRPKKEMLKEILFMSVHAVHLTAMALDVRVNK